MVLRQKKGLSRFVDLKNCPLVLKNLTQEKNDISYALNKYKDIAYFGKDLPISHYLNNLRTFNYSAELLLKEDGDYFRQACSTVVTSIIFAKYLGFKKIVLHGVDFFGGYFFDQSEYKNLSEFHPPYFEKNIVKGEDIYNKEWRDEKGHHPTSSCLYKFIPILKNKLKIENIKLYCAVKESPLSKILEVYN